MGGCDEAIHFRLFHGGLNGRFACGEVDVDRSLSGKQHRDIGQKAARAGRKHNPNPILLRLLSNDFAQNNRRSEKLVEPGFLVLKTVKDVVFCPVSLQAHQHCVTKIQIEARSRVERFLGSQEQIFLETCEVCFVFCERITKREDGGFERSRILDRQFCRSRMVDVKADRRDFALQQEGERFTDDARQCTGPDFGLARHKNDIFTLGNAVAQLFLKRFNLFIISDKHHCRGIVPFEMILKLRFEFGVLLDQIGDAFSFELALKNLQIAKTQNIWDD